MGEVIEFPKGKKSTYGDAVEYFQEAYQKAGLSDEQIVSAMQELEPFIIDTFPQKDFTFSLPADLNFNEQQIEAIALEHNRSMSEAIGYFGEQMWISLCRIAEIIGRNNLR
ncbi:hypothetical protein [Pleionea sp. CnH1-48]|uniref:hypothetical protein n=1 Tax=Pleionea sp. CnH1-48 TaxID=2954494 RepID=UPI002097C73C|nr:hypothetical protein [Pleionea sp. CnH1-48]MCO7223166.1 hypothetical protein [Pleionea sp. CnH1-48]